MFIIVLDYVLLEAIEGHEECLGLTMKPRQGRRVKAENVTKLTLQTTLLFIEISSRSELQVSEFYFGSVTQNITSRSERLQLG